MGGFCVPRIPPNKFVWDQVLEICFSVVMAQHFLGCGLPIFAAILRRPVPHLGFCLEKSIFSPRKSQEKADFGRKTYVSISGFLRQFCGRFSKVKIHLPMGRIAFFSVLSAHPRSCRPFPLNSNKLFFLPGEFLVLPHPSHNRKQPKLRVLVWVDTRLCPVSVFLSVWRRASARRSQQLLRFFGTLEVVRVSRACERNTWKHCVLLIGKIPTPIKIKLALPPPLPENPNPPPH